MLSKVLLCGSFIPCVAFDVRTLHHFIYFFFVVLKFTLCRPHLYRTRIHERMTLKAASVLKVAN